MTSQKEAHVAGIGISVPYPISTDRFLELDREMRLANNQSESTINLLEKFVKGTGINRRHYAHPHWLPKGEKPDDYPEAKKVALSRDIFTPSNYIPKYHERMSVFGDSCVVLAVDAAKKAIEEWGGDPKEISHIITTCTSGWSEPGIALSVIQNLNLSLDCQKAELNFNGCFCGATCLRIARDIIRAGDATGVLVVAVEVASSHYDLNATDVSSLVAHSLFADGGAAVVLTPEGGKWRYKQTGMSLVPDSGHLLGLSPPTHESHSGYRMQLDKNVGKELGKYFHTGLGTNILKKIHNAASQERPALGIHPGGPNILDNMKDVFQQHGWAEDSMNVSYQTLQNYGNLGAAAMLFVLANCWTNIDNDTLITMAFGPGVTVEWAILEKVN